MGPSDSFLQNTAFERAASTLPGAHPHAAGQRMCGKAGWWAARGQHLAAFPLTPPRWQARCCARHPARDTGFGQETGWDWTELQCDSQFVVPVNWAWRGLDSQWLVQRPEVLRSCQERRATTRKLPKPEVGWLRTSFGSLGPAQAARGCVLGPWRGDEMIGAGSGPSQSANQCPREMLQRAIHSRVLGSPSLPLARHSERWDAPL